MKSSGFLLKKLTSLTRQVADAVNALELRPTATPSSRPAAIRFEWLGLIMTGWWLIYPSEKYESQLGISFPNIPNIWKNKKMFQTTNQLSKLQLFGA